MYYTGQAPINKHYYYYYCDVQQSLFVSPPAVNRKSDSDASPPTPMSLRKASPTRTPRGRGRGKSCPPPEPTATRPVCGRSPAWRSAPQRRPPSRPRLPPPTGTTLSSLALSAPASGEKRKMSASWRPHSSLGPRRRRVVKRWTVARMVSG